MKRVLLMFPGQGSQSPGMAGWLAEFPAAMDVFERASRVLGWCVSEACGSRSAEELTRTDVAQPVIFTVSLATWAVLADTADFPDQLIFVGHSLGDYSALVACGHLDFDEALRVVVRRGRAMQACGEKQAGGMAAVLGLPDEAVETLCESVAGVWPANYNSPGQVVVSGTEEGLQGLAEAVRTSGRGKLIRLNVSGGFHSPLVAAATEEVAAALDATTVHPAARGVFYSTTRVKELHGAEVKGAMVSQLTSPVRFGPSVAALRSEVDLAIEVGPGKVLTGLVKRIDSSLPAYSTDSEAALRVVREALADG